jgi:hypothetical protein
MGATGFVTLDFGAFPGTQSVETVVTGQALIASTSRVDSDLRAVATAEHSIDEHLHESIKFDAHSIVAGTGFTVRAHCTNGNLYGQFNAYWVWV